MNTAILACKEVFNCKTVKNARNIPRGSHLCFIPYNGEFDLPMLNTNHLKAIRIAKGKQRNYMKDYVDVIINGIKDLDMEITVDEENITLRQVLTLLRTCNC